MKKNILAFAFISLLAISCNSEKAPEEKTAEENTKTSQPAGNQAATGTSQSTETSQAAAQPQAEAIPFAQGKNYFVKNTYKDGSLTNAKITTQAEFDKLFGMAATMAKNGKPTEIDFSKHYVIAWIGATTDKATTVSINNLKRSGNTITLLYSQVEGKKQTFSMRPLLLAIVEDQYQGEVKVEKQ